MNRETARNFLFLADCNPPNNKHDYVQLIVIPCSFEFLLMIQIETIPEQTLSFSCSPFFSYFSLVFVMAENEASMSETFAESLVVKNIMARASAVKEQETYRISENEFLEVQHSHI